MIADKLYYPELLDNVLKESYDIQIDFLRKFAERTNALNHETDGLLSPPDILTLQKEMLDNILRKVEELFEAEVCSIYVKETQSKAALRAARSAHLPYRESDTYGIAPAIDVKDKPRTDEKLGLVGWVISTGRPFLATSPEDVANHPHSIDRFDHSMISVNRERANSLSTLLIIPIRDSSSQIIGALKVQRSLSNSYFSVEDQIALEALAQIAGRCIGYLNDSQLSPVMVLVTAWALKVFADASSAEGELDSFLDIVVKVVAAVAQADACSIFLIDESVKTLTQRAGCGHQSLKTIIRSYVLPERAALDTCYMSQTCDPATCREKTSYGPSDYQKAGVTAWVAATGKSFYANSKDELRQHCHHRGLFDHQNFATKSGDSIAECSAWFGIPLTLSGITIGVLKVENKTPFHVVDTRGFSPTVRQQLEVLAQDIAFSIRKFQNQGSRGYQLINNAMPTILTILQGGLDIPLLVSSVVHETAKLFNARACSLYLKDGDQLIQPEWAAVGYAGRGNAIRRYNLVPVSTITENPAPSQDERDKKVGLTVWIAATKRKFSARSNQELRLHPHHIGTYDAIDFAENERCESFMGVPLLAGEEQELIGVLKVETKQRGNGERVDFSYFNEQDSIVFDLIANSAAVAIQNARLLAARRLADRILTQPDRYTTLKEIFWFMEQRVDVVTTLVSATRAVAERDTRRASIIEGVTGVLKPDFSLPILDRLIFQFRDSKDIGLIALTQFLELIKSMLQVKSLFEIYQITATDTISQEIANPAWILYNCSKKIIDIHREVAEYLKNYARDRYQIGELKASLDLLEKEIKEAENLSAFDRNVITRIFTHWTKLILAEMEEIPNPYIANLPLEARSAVFYGREEIFKWIDDSLHEQKAVLILHGGWHTGKTSILKQIQGGPFGARIREHNFAVPVYIDLQGIPDSSVGMFLLNLCDQISQTIDSPEIPITEQLEKSFEKTPYRTFDKFLEKAIHILAERGRKYLLILLDEFELLDLRVQQGRLDAEIFNYLRSKMQHHSALSFILAGRHRLEEMTPKFQNIIFNVGHHQEVGFLNPAEAQRLVTEPVKPYGVTYNPECIEYILKLTAGHPFFIQQLCQRSIALLNNYKKGSVVTQEILDQAIEDSLKYNQVLKELWLVELCENDRKFFQALADLTTQDDGWVKEKDISRHSLLSVDDITVVRQNRMIQKFIKQRQLANNQMEYVFSVDMFRLWIGTSKLIQ